MSSAVPTRTCVGCRRRAPQAEFLRVRRLPHGDVAPAERRGAAAAARGRSAYLCPARPCFEQAARRGGLARAFAREGRVHVDGDGLWGALVDHVQRERATFARSCREATSNPRFHQLLAFETAMLASRRGA